MARPRGSLDRFERAMYDETVEGTHHRRIELEVFRLKDRKPVMSLTERFLGGSVQGDNDQVPVTHLECDLLDPDEDLDWSFGSHRLFEVRVIDSRFVPGLNDWVSEVVFTGPMWNFDRDGALVHLVAHGPERKAMGSIRQADFWPAKTKATVVLSALLRRAGAEPRDLIIASLKKTLPRDTTVGVKIGDPPPAGKPDNRRKVRRFLVGRKDSYWSKASKIAEALDRDLFGDTRGRFVLESPKKRATLHLTERTILAPVTVTRGGDGEQVNTWVVLGPNPKGPKGRPSARVGLPRKHPASAESRAWNGTPRPVIETIENKHVKTDKQARKLAERRRDKAMRETSAYEVSALPIIPDFRGGLLVSVPVGGSRVTASVSAFTFPLGPGADPMTLGAARRRGFK